MSASARSAGQVATSSWSVGVLLDRGLGVGVERVGFKGEEFTDAAGCLDVVLEEVGVPAAKCEARFGLEFADEVAWFLDHCFELSSELLIVGEVSQRCEQDGERRQALLTVDDFGESSLLGLDEDHGSEEVRLVVSAIERIGEVIEQLDRLFDVPRIRTLVVGDVEVVVAAEDAEQRDLMCLELLHASILLRRYVPCAGLGGHKA